VTDFTGRRANEKLLGCEVVRDYIHLPHSRVPLLPPDASRISLADSRARSLLSDIPTTAGCHEPDAPSIRSRRNIARLYHRPATVALVEVEIFE